MEKVGGIARFPHRLTIMVETANRRHMPLWRFLTCANEVEAVEWRLQQHHLGGRIFGRRRERLLQCAEDEVRSLLTLIRRARCFLIIRIVNDDKVWAPVVDVNTANLAGDTKGQYIYCALIHSVPNLQHLI